MKLLRPQLVPNEHALKITCNMNQNNTYLCDEFLGAVYFQIKHTKKYLKKKFEINIYLYVYIFQLQVTMQIQTK